MIFLRYESIAVSAIQASTSWPALSTKHLEIRQESGGWHESCLVSGLGGIEEGRGCLGIYKQPRGEDKTCVSLEAVGLHPSLEP
jgi:hypothetical protein